MFFTNVTQSELLEGDSVVLNCHVHSYGELKFNVTVDITDEQSGRLTFEQYLPLNYSTVVQYNVNVTSSMSGPFYCNVTGVTMETVSKTLRVTLNRVLGELFRRVMFLLIPYVSQNNITFILVYQNSCWVAHSNV